MNALLDDLAKVEEAEEVRKAVARIESFRGRFVIESRYGLGKKGIVLTLQETASRLRVTRERTRQIQLQMERKLGEVLRRKGIGEDD